MKCFALSQLARRTGESPPFLVALWFASALAVSGAEVVSADLCIYGGTSAGVIAAVQAKKMGKTAVIAEFGRHLGGLSSGGLGYTDIGNKAAIGGLSREFYQRLGKHYGKEEAWIFEPGGAEREFEALVAENKIPVHRQQRLASVKKTGARLTEITMENGTVFRAKMFIDASYEGDLMAKAGVAYHVGREANATYGETLNGICKDTPKHQFLVTVDPFVKAGDASSGLLPFVQDTAFGTPGGGDASVQAYNFRLCLTKNSANRKPIDRPANYDERKFELLGRYFDALAAANKPVTLRNFLKIDMVTGKKTDINNNGGFSTDFIGGNHLYPEADYATREKIWAENLDYIKGFLTYLATSPRVPLNVREEMAPWGLCKDEFADTGGWPNQMYVREARRMISDYVMSEKNCRHVEAVPDSAGLAAYNMDSHNCRRIVRNGRVENEGDVQVSPMGPYAISYRSLVPKAAQCENLFVPVCLAASHIAYGSIRMEPVFMILGQTTATAACLALDDGVAVQKVDYAKLRARLLADGQILEWTKGPVKSEGNPKPAAKLDPKNGVMLDDNDGVKAGEWHDGSLVDTAQVGDGYIHDGNAHKGEATITWTPDLPSAGEYEIILIAPPHPNRASNVPVSVKSREGETHTVKVNQKNAAAKGLLSLGKFVLPKGKETRVTVSNKDTDGYVVVDGILFVPVK